MNVWIVEKTACYPRAYKVRSTLYRDDNSWTNFFATREEAESEAQKRNAKEVARCKWEHSGEGDYISPHAAFMPWFPFCPHCGKPVEVVG